VDEVTRRTPSKHDLEHVEEIARAHVNNQPSPKTW
jgi:hypothetical protein